MFHRHPRGGGWPKVVTDTDLRVIGTRAFLWPDECSRVPAKVDLLDEDGNHMATAVKLPDTCMKDNTARWFGEVLTSTMQYTSSTSSSLLPRTWQYKEVGWGSMPGSARKHTVDFEGGSSLLPFWTTDNEPAQEYGLDVAVQSVTRSIADSLAEHFPEVLEALNDPMQVGCAAVPDVGSTMPHTHQVRPALAGTG